MRGEREAGRWLGWLLAGVLLLAAAMIAGATVAVVVFLIGWAARIF